ncbi:MAG: CPBP family intramembrane glutamic endopeptidase [Pseudomonadota bacterium]
MQEPQTPWIAMMPTASDGPRVGLVRCLAAVGEVVFVLLALTLLARLLFSLLGLTDADAYLFPAQGEVDFRGAAKAEASWHALRYGLALLVVVLVGGIRRRRSLASYGVTLGTSSPLGLIQYGLVLFAVTHPPTLLLSMADRAFSLGPGLPFWRLMEEVPWDGDFWLFMAVSSFLVVPLVEEFMARGYLLGRLRESFSAGGALVVMGVLFAVAHTQYHRADLLSLGSLLTLVYGSVVWGYAVYRTGSLIPPMVAHALVNIPLAEALEPYLLVASVGTVLVLRKQIVQNARCLTHLFVTAQDWAYIAAVCVLLVAFGATLRVPTAPYLWLLGFVAFFIVSLRTPSKWSSADLAQNAS